MMSCGQFLRYRNNSEFVSLKVSAKTRMFFSVAPNEKKLIHTPLCSISDMYLLKKSLLSGYSMLLFA
jgi:hypothetical protein